MTVTNQRLVEILTTAMDKPEIANALIQRVINTLNKQPEPEPLPAKSKGALSHEENKQHNKKILDKFYAENAHLYTAPPQREWQGLTDEEIKEIVGPWGGEPIKGYTRELIDKIEAKLKEKNGA